MGKITGNQLLHKRPQLWRKTYKDTLVHGMQTGTAVDVTQDFAPTQLHQLVSQSLGAHRLSDLHSELMINVISLKLQTYHHTAFDMGSATTLHQSFNAVPVPLVCAFPLDTVLGFTPLSAAFFGCCPTHFLKHVWQLALRS